MRAGGHGAGALRAPRPALRAPRPALRGLPRGSARTPAAGLAEPLASVRAGPNKARQRTGGFDGGPAPPAAGEGVRPKVEVPMSEANRETSAARTRTQARGAAKDRWPLPFRLLVTVVFGCFAAIGFAIAVSDDMSAGEALRARVRAGGMALACTLAVVGLWVPLGRWAGHVAEVLRSLG
jgi:hypothetical protein